MEPKEKDHRKFGDRTYSTASTDESEFGFEKIEFNPERKNWEKTKVNALKDAINIAKLMTDVTVDDVFSIAAQVAKDEHEFKTPKLEYDESRIDAENAKMTACKTAINMLKINADGKITADEVLRTASLVVAYITED